MAIRPPKPRDDDEESDELDGFDETVFESVDTVEDFLAQALNQWPAAGEKL